MPITVTSKDFDNLSQRAQTMINDVGVENIIKWTGLSPSTVRRIQKYGVPAKARGVTAILLIGCLQAYEKSRRLNAESSIANS